ncbi:cytochrome C oxidase subunit IV family protein [Novosphingobium sp. NDB2Meth1]|uniref:cytochrome C oxidase subunit IV family protein n=1 Tax=Novosphingobium sp. NDB2Meth1 TaxID=1892847 RepID=UPI0009308C21|nr:cytochrome C oxidase subunit IV family protein [Novosphingobium sp. NDB2Meth1]
MSAAGPRHAAPVAAIWAVLAFASIAGFALAEGLAPARIAATAAILLAAVKINLIMVHYMDLTWSHTPLRPLLAAWLAVVTLILLGGYWSA